MERVQFRDYVFPRNPGRIVVQEGSHTVSHLLPGRGSRLQQLGPRERQVTCRGSFFGDSYQAAAAEVEAFRERVRQGEPGLLFLPGMAPFVAALTEFSLEAQGDGRILPYTMVFAEVVG